MIFITLIFVYYSSSQNWILTFPWPVTRHRNLETLHCHVCSYATQKSIILNVLYQIRLSQIPDCCYVFIMWQYYYYIAVSAALVCFHSYTTYHTTVMLSINQELMVWISSYLWRSHTIKTRQSWYQSLRVSSSKWHKTVTGTSNSCCYTDIAIGFPHCSSTKLKAHTLHSKFRIIILENFPQY